MDVAKNLLKINIQQPNAKKNTKNAHIGINGDTFNGTIALGINPTVPEISFFTSC